PIHRGQPGRGATTTTGGLPSGEDPVRADGSSCGCALARGPRDAQARVAAHTAHINNDSADGLVRTAARRGEPLREPVSGRAAVRPDRARRGPAPPGSNPRG